MQVRGPHGAWQPPEQPGLPDRRLPRRPAPLPPPGVQLALELPCLPHHPLHLPGASRPPPPCRPQAMDIQLDLFRQFMDYGPVPPVVGLWTTWTVPLVEALLDQLLRTAHPTHYLVMQVGRMVDIGFMAAGWHRCGTYGALPYLIYANKSSTCRPRRTWPVCLTTRPLM
jgi:hypothetical protein